jgi:acyl carrier protein
MSNIKNEILEIISKALEVDNKKINFDSSIENLDEWDSLGHLSILVSLDKKFNGNLASIKEMASVDSVKSIFKILENNNLI